MPVSEWFNKASPRVKSGEVRPETLDEDGAIALMLADPLLIRRPLMELGDRREAGFEPERIAAWIGLADTPQPVTDACVYETEGRPGTTCPSLVEA